MVTRPVDTHRALKLLSPLGEDLLLNKFDGQEKMGRPFTYSLDLRSTNPNIQFEQIVGRRVTVTMEMDTGERCFDGYVTSFRFTEEDGQFASYQATVRPWLWFLTQTSDCRIFQKQRVPDIIQSVFRDNGMSDFENKLSHAYQAWDYCVQYRETDFDFVSRLMEQEGIYYYFEHSKGKHVLVLADSIGAHTEFPNYATVPYYPPGNKIARRKREHLQQWTVTQEIKPRKLALTDFDFEKPKVDLITKVSQVRPHANPVSHDEIFDYPGAYTEFDQGDFYADIKLQEIQAQHETVQAGGNARGMHTGHLFTLENYPRHDQNKEYLIVAVNHSIKSDEFEASSTAKNQEMYRCTLEVLDHKQPFRSECATPRPVVQGPQTAIVVGPDDEEIYCDEYGRVKVQFHWDRYGKNDQHSSCWLRVSQAWAGKAWGSMHIPRIGHEVLVSFLEGDPDRPLITGRVYNASKMPPYSLEENKTQSGIKSRSTQGGTSDNFNEIRMEDKKGSEELYIQAERDETILVKNDKVESIGHNETIAIGNDRQESVGHDETLSIANNRNVSVGADQKLTVGADQKLTVGANETQNIGANLTVTVGADRSLSVSGSDAGSVGVNQTMTVAGQQSISVGNSAELNIGASYDISAGAPINITSAAMITLMAGGSRIEIGPQGVTIQTGGIINLVGSLIKLN